MAKRRSSYVPPGTPGKSWEKWKKENPYTPPDQPTTTTRIVKQGEKIPYGPGVPGRGAAR